MKRTPVRLLLALAVAVPILGACQVPPGPPTPGPRDLAGTSWVLSPDSLDVPIPAGRTITAMFSANGMSGNAACNSYRASYTAGPGNAFDLGEVITTRIGCEEPIMKAEQAFLGELARVTTYTLSHDRLRLGDGTGHLLDFRRAPEPPRPGGLVGSWTVTQYMNAGDGLSPVLRGTSITLVINADGSLGGKACNSYGADYTATGSTITISNIISTEMFCIEPDGVMQQESDYFTALQAARSWRVEGNTLTLSHPRGISVVAVRAQTTG
jgi:heat shock protein HslJ